MKIGDSAYFVNMTPHAITLAVGESMIEIAPSGTTLRLSEQDAGDGLIVDRQMILGDLPAPRWIPDKEPGCTCQSPFHGEPGEPGSCACGETYFVPVLFVVSALLAQAAARVGRRDFVAPDTGAGAIRDGDGKIVAVRRFVRYRL